MAEIPIPTEPTFSTGMKVSEAMRRAAPWWNEWRGAVSRQFNAVQEPNVVKASPRAMNGLPAPGFVVTGDNYQLVPSGILNGEPWDELTEMEQLKVTYQWHHDHVQVPQFSEPMISPETH